ncbi:MAG: hypothetical protein AB1798_07405 [Spirochaetota bacterium]
MAENLLSYVQATDTDIPVIRSLFIEYAESLKIDLSFQNFDEELRTLPGMYSQPEGAIYNPIEGALFMEKKI